MLADVINAAKITSAQKKELIERLSGTLCSHQAQSISKHIIALDKGRKGSSSYYEQNTMYFFAQVKRFLSSVY